MKIKESLTHCDVYTDRLVVITKPKIYPDADKDLKFKKTITDEDADLFFNNMNKLLANNWINDPSVEYQIIFKNVYGDNLVHFLIQHGTFKMAPDYNSGASFINGIAEFGKKLEQKFAASAPPEEYFEPPRP